MLSFDPILCDKIALETWATFYWLYAVIYIRKQYHRDKYSFDYDSMETKLYGSVNPRSVDDISDQRTQTLKTISGYAQEPLLPSEDACKPLKDIIPRLGAHISIAMHHSRNPRDGLTQDEPAAIHLCIMEWDEGTAQPHSSIYAYLNQTLRQSNQNKLRPWFRYLKLLLTVLVKLPSVSYRVGKDISADYSPGTEVTWWTFLSCTVSLNAPQSSLHLNSRGQRTLLSVEAINVHRRGAHSYPIFKDEIILLPGTSSEMKSRSNRSSH